METLSFRLIASIYHTWTLHDGHVCRRFVLELDGVSV